MRKAKIMVKKKRMWQLQKVQRRNPEKITITCIHLKKQQQPQSQKFIRKSCGLMKKVTK